MWTSRKFISHLVVFRIALILVLAAIVSQYGQVVGGTIASTITDPTEAPLPDAKVAIENLATQVTTLVTSNGDGFYTARNLLPGNYKLTSFQNNGRPDSGWQLSSCAIVMPAPSIDFNRFRIPCAPLPT